MGLKGLNLHINDIGSYLEKVASGQLPINHQIIYQLQDVFNLLPDVNLQQFVKAVYVKTNDQMLVVYVASLIRSVIALHNLINNKLQNRDAEKSEGKDPSKDKKKDKEEKGDGDKRKDGDKDKKKDDDKKDTDKKDTKKESSSSKGAKKWNSWILYLDIDDLYLSALNITHFWTLDSLFCRQGMKCDILLWI